MQREGEREGESVCVRERERGRERERERERELFILASSMITAIMLSTLTSKQLPLRERV